MERDITQLKENFHDLHKRYVTTDGKIDKILDILQGDDFAHGMIEAVKDHEGRIKKLEQVKDRATWVVMGLSIPTGYGVVEFLKKYIPQIFASLFILLLFTSCMTQKKREDIFHRHAREVPADVLDYCPDPSVVIKPGKPDTVTVTETKRVPVYVTEADTIWADCPEHEVTTVHKTDTATVVDQAPVMALADRLDRSDRDLAHERGRIEQLREQNADQGKRLAKQWWLSVGLGVGLLLSIVLRFVKF